MPTQKISRTVDDYIATFAPDIQAVLQKIRQTVKAAAPDAEETISYRMPAFKLNGMLVYFAAFKKHIPYALIRRIVKARVLTKSETAHSGRRSR